MVELHPAEPQEEGEQQHPNDAGWQWDGRQGNGQFAEGQAAEHQGQVADEHRYFRVKKRAKLGKSGQIGKC